ncbi:MAG: cardiolipin synthase [Clostridia bacterium]|nr:cardiolipin synthase [Clostridia bacterium]
MTKRRQPRLRDFQNLFGRRLLIILLVILQAVFSILLIMRYAQFHWIANVFELLSVITALHLLMRQVKPALKISLIFFILLFPLFGGILYWMFYLQTTAHFGVRKKVLLMEQTRRADYRYQSVPSEEICEQLPTNQILAHYLESVAGFPVYRNTESTYFPTGNEMLTSLLEDLKRAERYIFLEYFIIAKGEMWDGILEILCEKVAQGVDVRVIYDDFGCFLTLPPKYAQRLQQSGIQCRVFNKVYPLLSSAHNNRDHRKIAVIDGQVAYTGGINLADEYINKKIRYGHWKDCAIRIKGDGAWAFTTMFLQMWALLSGKEEDVLAYQPTPSVCERSSGWIQPYTDSPVSTENVGERVYMHLIQNARRYLYITTPYLMVDDDLISALKFAAKSGVDVRILTPEIPDKKLVHFTTRTYYPELLEAGVRIYEYSGGFIHSKCFISDDIIATVGTANLDFRSLYFHFECGTCLYRTDSILAVKQDFLNTVDKSKPIFKNDCKTGLFARLMQRIVRLFAPLM